MEYQIRALRKQAGLSQKELARRAGVSRTTLSGLENGTADVTTTGTLQKLADALGCTFYDLFLR